MVECHLSVSRVIGSFRALAASPNDTSWSTTRIIGQFLATAHSPQNVARLEISRIVGTFLGGAAGVGVGRFAVARVIGAFSAQARAFGDQWSAAGFPSPTLSGYSYAADMNVVRTKMTSGRYRQRRRWAYGWRQSKLTFRIPTGSLASLRVFLEGTRFSWFTMGMVSGDNTVAQVEPHVVRVIKDPEFSDFSKSDCAVTLTVEMK